MNNINIANFNKVIYSFGIITMLSLLGACENYQEVELAPTNYDDVACDRLGGMLSQEFTLADLTILGPQWQDTGFENAIVENERISDSWIDADSIITPDVFVFGRGDDIVALFSFEYFTFDSAQYDSIEVHYRFHEEGSSNFSGDITDTLMLFETTLHLKYVNFGQGIVQEDSMWDILISGNEVFLSPHSQIFRITNTRLQDYTSLPDDAYFTGDTTGFVVATEYLDDEGYEILFLNTTYLMELEGLVNSGYSLLNLEDEPPTDYLFYSDTYFSFFIFDTNGVVLTPSDEAISMETIAECHNIRTRTQFALSSQKYFVRFDPHEAVDEPEFRLTILREE